MPKPSKPATLIKPGIRRAFRLPAHCPPTPKPLPTDGLHTYYLSCDQRGLKPFLPLFRKVHVNGFRAAALAPADLNFHPPSVVVLGLVDGDTFEHAKIWANENPLTELNRMSQENALKRRFTAADGQKAQERFEDAVATIAEIEQQRAEAELELEAATLKLLEIQGLEAVCVGGVYYDVTYSRERVYLKRRHASQMPEEPEPPARRKPSRKKAAKRSRRAA